MARGLEGFFVTIFRFEDGRFLNPRPRQVRGQAKRFVHLAVSVQGAPGVVRAACIVGGPQRVRVGGVEMGLDALRRLLQGLPVDDLIDFEKQDVV